MDNTIHKSVQDTYRLISALDVAGRQDLSVPLRMIAARMWDDSVVMPNPFLFRKLEKETLSAWYEHLAPEQDRASSYAGAAEAYFFPIRRMGCRERSEVAEPGLSVHRAAGHIFSADHTFFISNLSDIGIIHTALALADDGTMLREDDEIIRGRKWDHVDQLNRIYEATAFGIPCIIEKAFFFHSNVDQHMNLVFQSVPAANLFAEHLREHGFRAVAACSSEFELRVARLGADRVFQSMQFDSDPDSAVGQKLRSELGVRRSEFIQAVRAVRNCFVNRCAEPGMNEEILGEALKTFWLQVELEVDPHGKLRRSRAAS